MNGTQHPTAQTGRRDQRAADRFVTELPIEISGAQGLTKNVSATGVYFETTVDRAPGSKVHFVVEVVINGENLKMVCAGEVVRVDRKPEAVGIAVKLSNSFFTDSDKLDNVAELSS